MKLYAMITASVLVAGSLASNAQLNAREIEDFAACSIDPKTMDPTKLSVLSVLKTAIPSGSAFPRPTGDFEPEWYLNLPADVKSLLPKLYPLPVVAASANLSDSASTGNSTTKSACITSTITKTLQYSPTDTAPANYSFTSNGTITTAAPSQTGYISAGARTDITTKVMASLTCVGLIAFCFA